MSVKWNKSPTASAAEVRSYRSWTFFVPGLTLLVFALLVTLPWGLGPELTYVPPLLILTMVFAWTVRRPTLMPGLLVFLVGVTVDVVTASPLGFWAFLFLCGYAIALHVARLDFNWRALVILMAYIPSSIAIAVVAWGLTSAYFGQPTDWTPLYESVKASWLVAPLLVFVTGWISHRMTKPAKSHGPTQAQS